MPKIIRPVADLDQSVTRPIITQIVNQLKRETQLPEDTMIWYPGPDGATLQPTSVIQGDPNFVSQEGSQQINRIGANAQVTIEVTEDFDLDWTLSSPTFTPENLFIFKDPSLGIFLKPAYSRTDVTIQVHFRAQSATQASQWRSLMRQRVAMQADVRLYDLTYSYYVLPTYLMILKELHRLRENVAGYGDTFDQYLKAHLVEKATQISDMAGKESSLRWTIPETQIRVPGYWDFDGFPETGTRDEKGGTWTATMAFKFKYDRPTTQVMFYPLMVHNQLLSKKYRPDMRSWENTHANAGWSLTANALRPFEGNLSRMPNKVTEGYRIPWFDEFLPAGIIPQTKNVITALVSIDPTNPSALFSLKDMGDFTLDPDIQAFMVGEAPYMTLPSQSVISLVLYQDENMMVPTVLSVDSDLTVTTTIPLDLRQVYHVRLALQYDLLAINPAAQVRMQQHCAATNKIITALDGKIKLRPGLPICSPTDTMTRWDYQQMSKLINARCGRNYGRIGTTMMETVGTLFVNTQRRGNFTDLAELERLEQRRRMMECLAARAAYPQPELYKHEQQEAWFDAHGESTGECSTGEEESSGEHISS
jgi:hypothetical protein